MKNYRSLKFEVNSYKGDENLPSRTLIYNVNETTLYHFLCDTNDERGIRQFYNTYDSDDAEALYTYAKDKKKITYEQINYDKKVIELYNEFRGKLADILKSAAPDITKENFYWEYYCNPMVVL